MNFHCFGRLDYHSAKIFIKLKNLLKPFIHHKIDKSFKPCTIILFDIQTFCFNAYNNYRQIQTNQEKAALIQIHLPVRWNSEIQWHSHKGNDSYS